MLCKKLYFIFSILQTRARNYLSIIFMYLQCVNDVVMIKVDDAASWMQPQSQVCWMIIWQRVKTNLHRHPICLCFFRVGGRYCTTTNVSVPRKCNRMNGTSFPTWNQHCPVRFLHEQFPGFVDSACQADRVAFVIHWESGCATDEPDGWKPARRVLHGSISPKGYR